MDYRTDYQLGGQLIGQLDICKMKKVLSPKFKIYKLIESIFVQSRNWKKWKPLKWNQTRNFLKKSSDVRGDVPVSVS